MNLIVIGAVSSVLLLAGCTQNEARRTHTPAAPAAAGPEMPKSEGPAAKAQAPDVNVNDREFQAEYGRLGAPTGPSSIDVPEIGETATTGGSVGTALPSAPVVRVEDPNTMAPTGPTPDLRLQPSRPVEIADASPDFPSNMPRPGQTAVTGTTRPATGETASTAAFRPIAPPTVEDEVETEAAPAVRRETAPTGARQATAPTGALQATAPTGERMTTAPTGARQETASTGPATSDKTSTTVVVIAPTGPAGRDGKDAKPIVAATSALRADVPAKLEVRDYKIVDSKAYSVILKPLIQKIRTMNQVTGDRLDKKIRELPLQTYAAADDDIWEHFRGEVLVSGFKLPPATEYRLVQLKNRVLIPAKELHSEEVTARWILEAALFRLAYDSTEKKDMQFMASVTGLAHSISDSFMKARHQMKKRQVYEYLRYAQISVDEWKFEQLDAIAASTAILRLSLRQYTVSMAQPENEFVVQTLNVNDPKDENCRVNITYHGIEKGVLVQVSEPKWPEFEFTFDVQSKETYPLRPSLAGDDFLDLEIIKKQKDESSLRLTVRYKVLPPGSEDERVADHMVLEKLPKKGKAEKILMCRIVPSDTSPPQARRDEVKEDAAKTGVTAVTGATAATSAVRGQEQRFRPMPSATGVTTPAKPATAATSAVRGQEQRFRPMPAATGVTGTKTR